MNETIKILIVEDEFLFAFDLKNQLSRLGYALCDIVSSGEKALELVREEGPDLVLMDLNLSGRMNGIDAAQKIRSLYEKPIIFMTGYADEESVEQIKQANPLGILTKPITARAVHSIIQDWQQG
jgi:CheY-like chemotaxis protein